MEQPPQADAIAVPAKPAERADIRFWRTFGFDPMIISSADTMAGGHDLGCVLPPGVLAFAVDRTDAKDIVELVQDIDAPAMLTYFIGNRTYRIIRAEQLDTPFSGAHLPETVTMLQAGDTLPLPTNPVLYSVATLAEMPVVPAAQITMAIGPKGDPAIVDSPLSRFSLRGHAEEFAKMATEAKPLLGNLCLAGQATVWYAPPNAGKTLIVLKLLNDAVAEGRINPDNVYYINADDSSQGFATKIRLMDDIGVHTLAPGYQGFQASLLPELFHSMADRKKAKGALVIIDTIKKAASLMDKTKASVFTHACRSAVMAGATIVGFAHTNKAPAASGKLQYGGTTDLRDDFDAAYVMGPVQIDGFDGDKVVTFECIKSRGPNAQSAAYAYADGETVPYTEKLASVRLVASEELSGFRRVETEKADADVVAAIEACIRDGDHAKMALAKVVAKHTGISERAAIRMIEKYTGTDPATARWCFQRKDRGAMIYALLPSPAPLAA